MRWRIIFGLCFFFFMLALAIITLTQTHISFAPGNSEAAQLELTTQFPNAKCRKTFSQVFPYVEFHCQTLNEQAENVAPSSAIPTEIPQIP